MYLCRIISPVFDLSGAASAQLSFVYFLYAFYSADEITVSYRTSTTDEWHSIAQYLFPTDGYEQVAVALPQPSATYQIAFQAKSNNAEGVYVDDVVVGDITAHIHQYGLTANVYPNPTTGIVTVESDAVGADITVYDAFGKRLMTSKVATERTELNFSAFAPGVYMVRIAADNGVATTKVVKQ